MKKCQIDAISPVVKDQISSILASHAADMVVELMRHDLCPICTGRMAIYGIMLAMKAGYKDEPKDVIIKATLEALSKLIDAPVSGLIVEEMGLPLPSEGETVH